MAEPHSILSERMHINGANKPLGEWTADEVRSRADELHAAAAVAAMARLASIARTWSQLAREMESTQAATVSEVDAATLDELAKAVSVVPPGGGLHSP